MKHMDIFFAVFFCICLSTNDALSIPAAGDNVTVETKHILEGDNLLLTCNTTELKDVQDFYWIRNGTYDKSSEFYSNGWKIEFFGITRQASDIYICHALNNRTGENITLTATKVDVQYPTECESMYLAPKVITENETFRLGCSMHGNPGPNWSIFNNETGDSVMEARGQGGDVSLSAIYVRCGYSGWWVCSGYNELNHGVNATRGFYLTVLCPPRPEPRTPSSYVYYYKATVGGTVTMALNVTADPAPMYTWSRGDNSPLEGPVTVIDSPKGTSLTLLDVEARDFGDYTLRMHNSYGSSVAHFTLRAHGSPGKPYDIRASNITDSSVDLTWTSGYDMGSEQRFLIMKWIGNQFIQISDEIQVPYKDGGLGQTWNYHQRGLDSDTEYKLAVLARNTDGMTFSEPILLNTTSSRSSVHISSSISIVVGGVVGVMILIIVAIAVIVHFSNKARRTSPLIGKQKLLQNIQSEYGGTMAGEYKKQPLQDSRA